VKLSLDTNWDDSLPAALTRFPVVELCAGLPGTVVGATRLVLGQGVPDDRGLRRHIVAAHDAGLEFVVVLDTPSMEGHEFEPDTHAALRELFGHLAEAGVDCVELGFSYPIEIVRRQYPRLKVRAAETFRIHQLHQLELLADLGARSAVACQWSNRNFPMLRAMAAVPGVDLWLNASGCNVREEPHYANLNLACAMGTLTSSRLALDAHGLAAAVFYFAHRVKLLLASPLSLLKVGFIRPEDVAAYERQGFERFRIDTAGMDTPQILAAAQAYADGRFDGNLCELVPFLRSPIVPPALAPLSGTELGELAAELLDPAVLARLVRVDNQSLAGFLDRFLERPCPFGCIDCDWCERFVKTAVGVEAEAARRYAEKFEALARLLEEGSPAGS
jgi:hypothetical protein